MTGWQPLDTAPRDGTRILVWAESTPGGQLLRRTFIARALTRKPIWWDTGDTSFSATLDRPGGWMPIPAPPDAASDEA